MNKNPISQIIKYLRSVRTELSLVEWIKGRTLVNYTVIVLGFTVALTLIIYVMDIVLIAARSAILGPTTI